MLKTAPGTKTTRYAKSGGRSGPSATSPCRRRTAAAGYSNQDDYRVSAAGYYDHLVDMFLQLAAAARGESGQWPATLEEAFGIAAALPATRCPARTPQALVDYFIDVYAPARSTRNLLRNFEGFILNGPEYLTVFDGADGQGAADDPLRAGPARRRPPVGRLRDGPHRARQPGRPLPGRRRLPRRQAPVGGLRPRLLHPYDARRLRLGRQEAHQGLVRRQRLDADDATRSTTARTAGTAPTRSTASITTQGFHSLSAADVDGDGKQEIVYGAATIDDDGSLLYSSYDVLPPGSADPGAVARLGHGDAHARDRHRPAAARARRSSPCTRAATCAPYGYALRDARNRRGASSASTPAGTPAAA